MPHSDPDYRVQASPAATFVTTHWSVVLSASHSDSPKAGEALEKLCATYWYPLYAHVRRRGHDAEAARDLTQGFFAQTLSKGSIKSAEPGRGRFRTFLLTALDNYLHHQHRDSHTLKRGGGTELVSWDVQYAERRFSLEPAEDSSPDREFDRRWALSILERVRTRLRNELSLASKAELFDLLRPYLLGDEDAVPYADIAAQLKMTVVAVKVTVHRLRKHYGELLRQEVSQTLADPADADQEIRHLIAALSG
jgi:RNA polymerase sigma-70 factor (ECF subfamily)